MIELLHDKSGAEAIMDVILVHGADKNEHDQRLNSVPNRIQESGLKLNKDKCKFHKTEITYFGQRISKEGTSADPSKVQAVLDLPAPKEVAELRRILDMIYYLGKFIPDLSTVSKPMTDLLKGDSVWYWGPSQEKSFSQVKQMVTSAQVLAFCDPALPTIVSADASSYGLGGVLFQVKGDVMRPVAFCSRTLSSTEVKYAQIEKECLAGVWGCEKFSRYLVGLGSFKLQTDHKPLVPLINSHDLNFAPLRCQRLLMRLRRFNLTAEYVPGKSLIVISLPDTLSRSPLTASDTEEVCLEDDLDAFVEYVSSSRPMSDEKVEALRIATSKDEELQTAIQFNRSGWPDHICSVPLVVHRYHQIRGKLSVDNHLLIFRDRIVVPVAMRQEILGRIHQGHEGVNKCVDRTATCVWWPGISKDINDKVSQCEYCTINRPSQRKEKLQCTVLPEWPWEKVGADLCYVKGENFLIVIDYYSRFIEIAHLSTISSKNVIGKLEAMFARFGVPAEFCSDNGTQFTSSEFQDFAHEYGFKLTTSSPHYPQANGEAESGVRIAKLILQQDDAYLPLMAYRSTPMRATGKSPAQLVMGRQIRTNLPILPGNLKPSWTNLDTVRETDAKTKTSPDLVALLTPPIRYGDWVE